MQPATPRIEPYHHTLSRPCPLPISGFSVSPPAKSFLIAGSANGTPKSGELPKTISFTVLQGSADLSNDAGTTYSIANVNCTAAMGGTNGKVWTCTSIAADTDRKSTRLNSSH